MSISLIAIFIGRLPYFSLSQSFFRTIRISASFRMFSKVFYADRQVSSSSLENGMIHTHRHSIFFSFAALSAFGAISLHLPPRHVIRMISDKSSKNSGSMSDSSILPLSKQSDAVATSCGRCLRMPLRMFVPPFPRLMILRLFMRVLSGNDLKFRCTFNDFEVVHAGFEW